MSCGTNSIGRAGAIEIALEHDIEILAAGSRPVIRGVQRFVDERIQIDLPPLAAAAARMRQHAGDDRDPRIGPGSKCNAAQHFFAPLHSCKTPNTETIQIVGIEPDRAAAATIVVVRSFVFF